MDNSYPHEHKAPRSDFVLKKPSVIFYNGGTLLRFFIVGMEKYRQNTKNTHHYYLLNHVNAT